MNRILIAENLPSYNKGEMAIAEGILECISGQPCTLSMLSYFPEFDRRRYSGRVEVIDVRNAWPLITSPGSGLSLIRSADVFIRHLLFAFSYRALGKKALAIWTAELWGAYADSDVIIYGHDSSFGVGGDPENPLLYPIYIPIFARLLGKPTMFFAGTVPLPPKRFHNVMGQLFRLALLASSKVTLRESGSLKNIEKFGNIPSNTKVTSDIAYLIQPVSPDRVHEILYYEGVDWSQSLIGMTISRVRASVAHPNCSPEESYRKHIMMMANAVDKIVKLTGAKVIFLPHSVGMDGAGDDRMVSEDVKSSCVNGDAVTCISGEYTPNELKGIIGECKVFVGERLHSVIGASSLGVPTVAISYVKDPRLGMVRPMVTDKCILYLESLTVEKLVGLVEDLWNHRDEVSTNLKERAIEMRRLASINGDILKDLLERGGR